MHEALADVLPLRSFLGGATMPCLFRDDVHDVLPMQAARAGALPFVASDEKDCAATMV